jgi:Ca2+-binding EF-hand superfamily protein
VLLRDLRIQLSEPKALAYFKKCDKMRRGSISFEEFRLALYTCDPKNPNRTMGFAPGQSLSPKDLFEMFDKEEEGAVDRATFIEILAFLGKPLPLDKMEAIFSANENVGIAFCYLRLQTTHATSRGCFCSLSLG